MQVPLPREVLGVDSLRVALVMPRSLKTATEHPGEIGKRMPGRRSGD